MIVWRIIVLNGLYLIRICMCRRMILIYLPKTKINHFDFWESATVCNDDHLIVRDSDALINLFDDLSIDLLPSEKDSPTLTQIRALQAEILDCDRYLLIMNISYPYLDFPALIDENRSPNSGMT